MNSWCSDVRRLDSDMGGSLGEVGFGFRGSVEVKGVKVILFLSFVKV